MATTLQTILLILTIHTISCYTYPDTSSFIVCPPSKQCTINCLKDKYCVNKTIICPSQNECKINCYSEYSCSNTTVIANYSSNLKLYALSSYCTYNANIYCPSSQASCQIYGDSISHSPSNYQWDNINIHINSPNNHQLICKSSQCAHHGTISLYCDINKYSNNICKLSNIDYQCMNQQSICNQINSNSHYNIYRQLLGAPTSTNSAPNMTLTQSTIPLIITHSLSQDANNWPFGLQLTATETSWVLFGAAVFVILLICILLCLIYCICKQNCGDHKNSSYVIAMNDKHDGNKINILVLAYEDGRKIKIPFDIATLDNINNTNNNNIKNKNKNNRGRSNSNYLSDSLHAALSDENNKIISAVLLDSNNDPLENSNDGHDITMIVEPLTNIDNTADNERDNPSPIDVIMEDTDITDNNNGGKGIFSIISDDDTLLSPNMNTQLIKVGGNGINGPKQRIIQTSISNSMDLPIGYKKYKQRKDSDVNADDQKESELTQSSTITTTISASHGSMIELQLEPKKLERKQKQKPTLNNYNNDEDELPESFPNGDKKIIHHQSSSQPQILKSITKKTQKHNISQQQRPKTAHPISPKQNENVWIDKNGNKFHKLNRNNSLKNSWDSENTVIEHVYNAKFKQYGKPQPIPSIQTSCSVPTFVNMNDMQFIQESDPNHIAPPILSSGMLTPSKKGLRRSSKPLPKPLPNKSNKSTKSTKSNKNTHIISKPNSPNSHHNDHKQIPFQTQQYQQTSSPQYTSKRYMNAAAMQYQMIRHHQRHQRTLPPHHNSHCASTASPPPPQQQQQLHSPPISREDINSSHTHSHRSVNMATSDTSPRHKYHRHMSEPSIPTYDGPFTPPNMPNIQCIEQLCEQTPPPNHHKQQQQQQQQKQQQEAINHDINTRNTSIYGDCTDDMTSPIAYGEIDTLLPPPITPIIVEIDCNEQSKSLRTSSNSRARSKSIPTKHPKIKPPRKLTDGWEDDDYTGFVINNALYYNQSPVDNNKYNDSSKHIKSRKKKKNRKNAICIDNVNNHSNNNKKRNKKEKGHKSSPKRVKKRKASTPTPNNRNKRKHKHRQHSGSDKLRRIKKDPNPFPRSTDLIQKKINIAPIDQNIQKPILIKKDNKQRLHPPHYNKNNKKKRNNKSNSEPWHNQPHYFRNNKYHRSDRKKLQSANSSTSTNTNITSHNSLYTVTTTSETPIPREINPSCLAPINIQLVNVSIGAINGQQGSPGKTTTISSAYVPPPPSPQLTKNNRKNKNNMDSPPFQLNIDRVSSNNSNNTDNTATFDGDDNNNDNDSDSSLSQDTANSNTNTRSKQHLISRTPTRDLSGSPSKGSKSRSKSINISKTITYRNMKYNVGSPDSACLSKSPPQPTMEILTNNIDDKQQTHFKIRVEGANDTDITHNNTNSSDSDYNSNSNSNSNSHSVDDDDGDNTDISSSQSTDNSESDSFDNNIDSKNKTMQLLKFERKHYIVNSMDSDKMIFIPPVPMQHNNYSTETNYTRTNNVNGNNNEYDDVPPRNPYAHRKLRPLPDTASIGTISPDWKSETNHNNKHHIEYQMNKKFKHKKIHQTHLNHQSGSSDKRISEIMDVDDMVTISTVTKTPSPEQSHNDEEKAYAPSHPANNPYLLEPKKNSNDNSNTLSNISSTSSNPSNLSNNNHYNNDYEKEYYFAHQLEETIKSLTKSDNGSTNNDQFIAHDSFMKITDDNIWHRHRDLNDDYVE